jgi:hypothetical protein
MNDDFPKEVKSDVAQFQTTEQFVEELRDELKPLLEAAAKVMTKASRHSLTVGFNIARTQSGVYQLQEIVVQKFY